MATINEQLRDLLDKAENLLSDVSDLIRDKEYELDEMNNSYDEDCEDEDYDEDKHDELSDEVDELRNIESYLEDFITEANYTFDETSFDF